jgi:hypothetical protein
VKKRCAGVLSDAAALLLQQKIRLVFFSGITEGFYLAKYNKMTGARSPLSVKKSLK